MTGSGATSKVGLERLYSARTIRALLDVPDRTFRRWIAAGRFPRPDVRIGRRRFFNAQAVRGALAERAAELPSPDKRRVSRRPTADSGPVGIG